MTREIKRAYRILGLQAGAPRTDIKAAYRDLAQVWHPDRFAHSERLQEKAERNLKRINEAFQTLEGYDPPAGGVQESALSSTMSAVLDMGDMLQSRAIQREKIRFRAGGSRQPGRTGNQGRVVGLEEWERTGVLRKRRVRSRKPALWIGVLGVLLLIAVLFLAIPLIRSFLFGP